MVETTVDASLEGSVRSWMYLVKASVMHSLNFFPASEVFKGPNRSACTCWLGSMGWSRLETMSRTKEMAFLIWNQWHISEWAAMLVSMLGP
jgi:hypothetical protein